jgi:hypothetical protein
MDEPLKRFLEEQRRQWKLIGGDLLVSPISEEIRGIQETIASYYRLAISDETWRLIKAASLDPEFVHSSYSAASMPTLPAWLLDRQKEQEAQWRRLLGQANPGFPEICESVSAWKMSSKTSLEAISASVSPISDEFVRRLTEPLRVHSTFVMKTAEMLSSVEGGALQRALDLSLHLADEALLSSPRLYLSIESPSSDEPTEDSAPPVLNLLDEQQTELIDAPTRLEGEDAEGALQLPPATQVSRLSRRVVRLVADVNEARKVNGQGEVFKPTTRAQAVATELPWITAIDDCFFGVFIDSLFFLVYESAGSGKFRLLCDHGGPLDPAECEIVWQIKRLRLWRRHDMDHGDSRDVEKKWTNLGSDLQALGVSKLPTTRSEFQNLQRRILEELEKLLQLALDRSSGLLS